MPRSLIQAVLNNLPSYGVTQGQLSAAFTPSDPANGNLFTATGRDILIVTNTDPQISPPATHYLTILSFADPSGRKADVTNYAILPGGFVEVTISSSALYTQTDGNVYLNTDSAFVEFLLTH